MHDNVAQYEHKGEQELRHHRRAAVLPTRLKVKQNSRVMKVRNGFCEKKKKKAGGNVLSVLHKSLF